MAPGIFDPDQFHDPEFRSLVQAARAVVAERVHRGGATPPERLAGAALSEMPDEDDPAAVRAWVPSAAFRDAVRSVVLATLAQYLGIVEAIAEQADQGEGEHNIGEPVSSGGDVNDDGCADLLIGGRGQGGYTGSAYVISALDLPAADATTTTGATPPCSAGSGSAPTWWGTATIRGRRLRRARWVAGTSRCCARG